jgi:PAS domain-containing protein
MASASRWLPRGNTLPTSVWRARHRGILILLVAHVPAVFLFALARGESILHGGVESALVASWAVAAVICRRSRATATVAASLGLLTASAVLVHLSGGVIELHFHYFVMVGVVTLYQEWRPFLIAIGYVVFQHGLAGAISPESVYNHESAVAHPWLWAGIHGVFILAMSVAGIVSWKLSETLLAATVRRESSLAEAQSVGRLGSWELDRTTGVAEWSDEMYRVLGVLPGEVQPGPDAFLACVHPDDSDGIRAGIASIVASGHEFTTDFRVVPADGGPARWLHGRWRAGEHSRSKGRT